MAFNISDMRANLTGGGARNTLFKVFINNPITPLGDLKTPFMVKAAQLPESVIGQIEVPYAGRKIKVAGDRTFSEWTTTVINDEDFAIRHALETWSNAINSHEGNSMETGSSSPASYKANAQIVQYSKTGQAIREYTMDGMFPINISTIEMSWESNDQIEEFTVSWALDFWRAGGITGVSTS